MAGIALISLCGCAAPSSAPASASAATPAPGAPADSGLRADAQNDTATGTVAETMDSGGYTYVRLKTQADEIWLAATDLKTKAGDRLTVGLDVPMRNFHSKTLDRDFPLIYFVSRVARDGESLEPAGPTTGMPMGASHDSTAGSSSAAGPAPAARAVDPVAPPAGGVSIADLWSKRSQLAGQDVVVRGQVVKANNGIMGRNWFHLQDGSGQADDGTNDLTITTEEIVTVGDVVTVSGTLTVGKDFGAGYAYDAIIENARVKK